jgi:hypothetical protein
MRRLFISVLFLLACEPAPAEDNVCAKAAHVFERCGASLPLLDTGSCTGLRKAVATCVADHATTCDELGSLTVRLDACVDDQLDGGDAFTPPDDLPTPAIKHDAGHAEGGPT